jgi:hypothetical protein
VICLSVALLCNLLFRLICFDSNRNFGFSEVVREDVLVNVFNLDPMYGFSIDFEAVMMMLARASLRARGRVASAARALFCRG